MGVEKPDPGAQPVKVKLDPDRTQTLQHFDFVDSDEESVKTRKPRNHSIGQGANRNAGSSSAVVTASSTHPMTASVGPPSTAATSSCGTNYTGNQPKRMKCKHAVTKGGTTNSAVDKKTPYEPPTNRKLTVKTHSNNKTDVLKDVCPKDGQILTPQPLDAAATPSPLKGLESGDVSAESSLRPSLLDEVLSEKKLLLMRSPSVITFFKRHQILLAKRSSNILQLGPHAMMDKPPGKS